MTTIAQSSDPVAELKRAHRATWAAGDYRAIAPHIAGVEIEWVRGDAEALPFDDGSFDSVTSVFGAQFAPRHQVVADELMRVCRPDGTIGLVNWTPEGLIGEMFQIMGRYLPAPPAFAAAPPLWGDERHVHELFAGMNKATDGSCRIEAEYLAISISPTNTSRSGP